MTTGFRFTGPGPASPARVPSAPLPAASSGTEVGEGFLAALGRVDPDAAPTRVVPAALPPAELARPMRVHPLLLGASLGIIPLVLYGAKQDGLALDPAVILGVFMAWGVFVILGFGVAWVAWRLSGRENAAASSAFGVLLIVAALGMFSEQARDARESAKRRRYEERVREHADRAGLRARQRLESGATVQHDAAETAAMVGTLDDAARELTGPAAGIARACARVLREIEAERADLDVALSRFLGAGGFDPATLRTPDAIAARLRLLADLEKATSDFHAFFAATPRRLRLLLSEEGVPRSMIDREVAGFERGARMDLVRESCAQERLLQGAGRAQLEILRAYFGYWQMGPGGVVEFDPAVPAAVVTRFNRQAEQLGRAAERQAQIQAEFFGAERPRTETANVPTIQG